VSKSRRITRTGSAFLRVNNGGKAKDNKHTIPVVSPSKTGFIVGAGKATGNNGRKTSATPACTIRPRAAPISVAASPNPIKITR